MQVVLHNTQRQSHINTCAQPVSQKALVVNINGTTPAPHVCRNTPQQRVLTDPAGIIYTITNNLRNSIPGNVHSFHDVI